MNSRSFHIGDILSITTEKLLSPRLISGVYDILNFMTNDNLYTHQLMRAKDECRPYLIKQHPKLAAIDAAEVTRENWRSWLDARIAEFGETLPVNPLPEDIHEFIEPISELAEIVHPSKIIVVNTDDGTVKKLV